MAFDGITTKAVASEISTLCGARIDKVFEPNKNDLILGMYLDGKNYALNICIDAQNCRINLTTNQKANPQVAPNFCMLLRKNLIGLKLKNIYTLDLERLVILEFEGFDDADDIVTEKLIVELMGKHSNIILLDDNNIIIDCLRHIKEDDEKYRNILPHTKYEFPTTDKLNFLEIKNFEEFKENIYNSKIKENINSLNEFQNFDISTLPTIISEKYNGISKNFIQAIIKKCNIKIIDSSSLETIYNYIKTIINNIDTQKLNFEEFTETTSSNKTKKDYFLVLDETVNLNFRLNFFIDDFYYEKESSEDFKNYQNTLLRLILETLKKYKTRLNNINKKLEECDDMEKYRLWGELITANLYRIPNKNIEEITVENYYDNNNKLTIKLDKKYLPSINAKRFFKKYSKLKNALEVVSKQKKETLRELNYIESIVYEIESSTTIDELTLIFDEISENDIFKERTEKTKQNKKNKIKKSKLTKNKEVSFNPIKYKIGNYTVLVGRNNVENDYLTLKYARKTDLWFHTKDFHGSHTILKIDNNLPYPSQDILIKVAEIAAKHSKAKNSSNVPVDYCEVKYVKKPSGSRPGMVIYTNNKTLNVNP